MKGYPGMRGIAYKEDLLWEKSHKGRVGISIPKADVPGTDRKSTRLNSSH